jgi:hypothetical protein
VQHRVNLLSISSYQHNNASQGSTFANGIHQLSNFKLTKHNSNCIIITVPYALPIQNATNGGGGGGGEKKGGGKYREKNKKEGGIYFQR